MYQSRTTFEYSESGLSMYRLKSCWTISMPCSVMKNMSGLNQSTSSLADSTLLVWSLSTWARYASSAPRISEGFVSGTSISYAVFCLKKKKEADRTSPGDVDKNPKTVRRSVHHTYDHQSLIHRVCRLQ